MPILLKSSDSELLHALVIHHNYANSFYILYTLQFTNDLSLCFCTGTVFVPFDAHCCHMGTAIKHPVPEWVKPSFVIFDIRAL